MQVFSTAEQKVLFFVSWFTGTLSILGSSAIIYIVLADFNNKFSKVYQRLLFTLSICDLIQTVWHILGALVVPRETPGVFAASGNQATCTAAGFFLQFGLAVPVYNGALCLFYLLTIRFSIKEEVIAKYVEPFMHATALLYPLGTAIAGVFLELFNPVEAGTGCWIASYPMGCSENGELECTRGKEADSFVWLFAGIEVFFLFIFIIICMFVIYSAVRQQESSIRKRYKFGVGRRSSDASNNSARSARFRRRMSSGGADFKRTRRVANQALWYIGSFFVTFIWSCFIAIFGESFFLEVLAEFFLPMQGFLTFWVYIRPRLKCFRRDNPDKSFLWALRSAVFTKNRTSQRARHRRSTLTGMRWSTTIRRSSIRTSTKAARQKVSDTMGSGDSSQSGISNTSLEHDVQQVADVFGPSMDELAEEHKNEETGIPMEEP